MPKSLRTGLPLSSGQEELRSRLTGEASRKVVDEKGHMELTFPLECSPFLFFPPAWKCEQILCRWCIHLGSMWTKPACWESEEEVGVSCVLKAQERCLTLAACLWTLCDARKIKPHSISYSFQVWMLMDPNGSSLGSVLVYQPHGSWNFKARREVRCLLAIFIYCCYSVDQSSSRVPLFTTPWTAAHQASVSFTNSWSSLKLTSVESVMLSKHLTSVTPLLLLPSVFPSIRFFSNKLALCIRWPKCWCFSFSISPSNEYSGLISLRIDWLDLLAVQRTLKMSLLQNPSSKASVLQRSAFFIIQLRVRHDWATSLSLFIFMHWRRRWQPTPVFLPGESQGRGSLVGCCLWDRTESDTTEVT